MTQTVNAEFFEANKNTFKEILDDVQTMFVTNDMDGNDHCYFCNTRYESIYKNPNRDMPHKEWCTVNLANKLLRAMWELDI